MAAWTSHDPDTAMSYIADDIVCDTPAAWKAPRRAAVSRARSWRSPRALAEDLHRQHDSRRIVR
jgi:hypothetical protein